MEKSNILFKSIKLICTILFLSILVLATDNTQTHKASDRIGLETLNSSLFSQGDVLYVNSTEEVDRLAPGTSGQYLKTQGAGSNPIWSFLSIGLNNLIDGGGLTQGDILIVNSSNNVTTLAPGTSGQYLKTNGAGSDPSWGTVTSSSGGEASAINSIGNAIMQEHQDGDDDQYELSSTYKNMFFATGNSVNYRKTTSVNLTNARTSSISIGNKTIINLTSITELTPNTITQIFPFVDYTIMSLVDNFDDNTLNTSLWVDSTGAGGNISEANTHLIIEGANSESATYNLDLFQKQGYILFYSIEAGSPGEVVSIGDINGNSLIGIALNLAVTGWILVEFNYNGDVRVFGAGGGDDSLWKLKIITSTRRYLTFKSTEGNFRIDGMYHFIAGNSTSSTVNVLASADGGTNYDIATNGQWKTMTTGGTLPKMQLDFQQADEELIVIKGMGMIWN